MLVSCSKYGRMKEIHFDEVQYTKEMSLDRITIGFEPERFKICIASDKEWIDQVAQDS